jgi:hypothetical protein
LIEFAIALCFGNCCDLIPIVPNYTIKGEWREFSIVIMLVQAHTVFHSFTMYVFYPEIFSDI